MTALPWLSGPLAQVLAMPRAHAVLLHAAPGAGALELATASAHAWLCETTAGAPRPCGACTSCRLAAQRAHPDLVWLVPEELRVRLGWAGGGDGAEAADGEETGRRGRKPSKQIRIDDVRDGLDWIGRTTSRGRAKVLVIHPAEALNPQSASALLKTLEEPPQGARLLLTAAEPARLLPTVLSRCQRVRIAPPATEEAVAWLAAQGLARPEVLLAAAGGLPLDALALAEAGVDAAGWSALPATVAQGRPGALAGWPVPRVVDALQKLCHDAMRLAAGSRPRFFAEGNVPRSGIAELAAWARELSALAERAEHPWNEGLLLEAALVGARRALSAGSPVRATLRR